MRIPDLGPRGEGWVVLQTACFAGIAVASISGPRWPHSDEPWLGIVGWILFAVGLTIAAAGRVELKSSFTVLPRPHDRAAFRSEGIYRYVRHPMYGGLLVLGVGLALIKTWAIFVPVAILAVVFTLKSIREEAWLTVRYPEYRAYRMKTRHRYVPWLV